MTRSLRLRRILATLTIAPLVAAGLAACGSESNGSTEAQDPAAASPVGAQLHPGDEVDPADFVETVRDGLDQSTSAHATLRVDLGSSGSLTAQGDLDYTTSPPSMSLAMKLPSGMGTADLRMVDGMFYLSMGQLTQGKFWKIDPSDPDGPLASLGMDKLLDRMDPGKAVERMGDGISKVVYVGDEDGLDRYTLTVDLEQALAAFGADLPPKQLAQLPDSMTYDLWLDDQGRLSKMDIADLPTGTDATWSMEMTLSDWGVDVDVEAPPADQVTETPDFGGAPDDA